MFLIFVVLAIGLTLSLKYVIDKKREEKPSQMTTKKRVSDIGVLTQSPNDLLATPVSGNRSAYTRQRIEKMAKEIQRCLDVGWSPSRIAKQLSSDGFGRCADTIRREILRQFIAEKGRVMTTPHKPRVATPNPTPVPTKPSEQPSKKVSYTHAGFREDPV